MSPRHQAVNLADNPCRDGRHNLDLPQGAFGKAEPSEQFGQVDVLQLQRSPPRKLGVQMLPSGGEGLMQCRRLGLQSLRMSST